MNYLILNRRPLATRPYREWIGDDHTIVLITDAGAPSGDETVRSGQLATFDDTITLANYHDSVLVEHAALRLHAEHHFDEIIAMSEFDLLRAGRLRDLLGLPGQSHASAAAFRDKLLMKDLLRAAGVPLASYAAVPDVTSLLRFTEEHGFPVVVKPRRGGGSMGVEVLRDDTGLWEYAGRAEGLGGDDESPLLVETYVEHELLHIDGLVVDGDVKLLWPSSQGTSTCLGMLEGHMLHSAMLDGNDPLLDPLRKLTLAALEALPTPATAIVHAEVFGTRDGLVFNEIACRMAGGRIEEQLELGYGTNLPELYVRALTGAHLPDMPEQPKTIAGLALFPPRAGKLLAIPTECHIPGVTGFTVNAEPGTRLQHAHASVDNYASALAVGTSRDEVEQVIAELKTWVESETVIELDAATGTDPVIARATAPERPQR
ncbi:hypothetical protein [Streptomyces sp. NPDC058623]|uniref:ATP-grasp domain-containing protein n=1 Tax=Streptomyces sp. NPDC058623 TaxID=3346563 RepID=UPI00365831EE